MKPTHWIILALAFILASWFIYRTRQSQSRIETTINLNWRFAQGDPENAQLPGYNDNAWRYVTLPHDWMIEQQVDRSNPSGTAGGYYPGGIAWYRKALDLSEYRDREQFYLIFDGIQRNADVWFNGSYLGRQVYGYSSFYHDVSQLVRTDTLNVIAVRTDCTEQPSDRWYPGAGIYRNVKLVATHALHHAIWGSSVTSVIDSSGNAELQIGLDILNNGENAERFEIRFDVIDPQGNVAADGETSGFLEGGESKIFRKEFALNRPALWSPDDPQLYEVNCYLAAGNRQIDRVKIVHGFRTAVFDPGQGFLLNGEKLLMKGVCIHHDGGELGAAVPLESWKRRFRVLKELGVNAIRLAHNPHAPEVLDLCDRMGFLVIDEMYDKWEMPWRSSAGNAGFAENWEKELSNFIRRDRNHPSVVLWSVGNETLEQLNDPGAGITLYNDMKQLVASIDPSRPVTCALHPGNRDRGHEVPSSMMHVSRIVSYNYRTDSFRTWHRNYPELVFIAAETKAYGTGRKQDYREISYLDNSWNDMDEFVAGQFIWTGFDYLGESMGWPDRGFRHGLAHTNGFIKPHAWYIGARYREDPLVKLAVKDSMLADSLNKLTGWQTSWSGPPLVDHWTFTEQSGEKEIVVFTNCPRVELKLNGRMLGTLHKDDFQDGVMKTTVHYEPGELVARAFHTDAQGRTAEATDTLITASGPHALAMRPEEKKLSARERRLLHIATSVEDSSGTLYPHGRQLVRYRLEGPGRIRAIDNGDPADHTAPGSSSKELRKGRQLLILQAGGEPGDLIISATSEGLKPSSVKIESK